MDQLAEAVGDVVPLEVLEREIVTGATEASAHLAWWLERVGEFDRREGWAAAGLRSCAHWLAWRCGLDARTARGHVQVARALSALPRVRAAFAEGRLSYSKVRAICRVATADNEELLLGLALDLTAAQLDRTMASYARVHGGALTLEADGERRERCGVRSWVDDDGLTHVEAVLAPEDALMVDLALRYGADRLYAEARAAAEPGGRVRRPGGAAGRLASLVWVLRRGLANAERRDIVDDARYLIVLHVEQGAAFVTDDGSVDLGNGLSVHPRTVQRLGCEGLWQTLVEDATGRPLDLGRRVRSVTPKQKLALAAMYGSCEFPGCDVDVRWCEFHHVALWSEGGRSDLENYRPLCRYHHHACHEGGWRLAVGVDGRTVAIPPDGRPAQVASPPPADLADRGRATLQRRVASWGVDVDSAGDELPSRCGGERLDEFALDVILHALAPAPHVDRRLVSGTPPSPN